ncbi:branched-chain amino acid transport system substrate-binding protein [Spinactinospora alkalitolerans]|uniref:Branched-chain amino acid transport system substrate-binding protein n=1 Tax=Spinactinospora alkalitolerans TaxID=687207 RepID=A0A852TSZ4_9ACTN|nr:ABC transporter substrate-binding protein [Spinactinospora alkalitolerans]NYE45972.1 branched-chain amino acid transport system substrate-binding protein [Spinactinospora alkalitolerans]
MRRLIGTAAAVTTLALASACGGSAPAGVASAIEDEPGSPVRIGALHPLTGASAGDGQQMSRAVRMAAEDVNADGGIDGLGGAELEVLTGDTQAKPEIGQSEAQRLLQSGVSALVGPFQSATASNVAAVAERSEVPFVIDVAAADDILEHGYEHTFRIQPNASMMGAAASDYLQQIADSSDEEVQRVAFLHEQSDFGTSVAEAFTEAAEADGIEVDPVISYDAAKVSDLTTEVTRAKAADVDVIAASGYYRDGLLLARNIAAVDPDVHAVFGVANGAFDLPEFPRDAGAAGAGYLDSNYYFDATDPEVVDIRERYEQRYGEEMRTAAVLSYDAVRVIADALERAGTRDPQALRDAIAATSIDSLLAFDGPIAFDSTGQNTNAMPILTQVRDGEVRPVFPETFAVEPPRFPAPPGSTE